MTRKKSPTRLLALLLMLLAPLSSRASDEAIPAASPVESPSPPRLADQIVHLKNGSVIRGSVTSGAESIVIETSNGVLTVPTADVLKIQYATDEDAPVPVPSPPTPPTSPAENTRFPFSGSLEARIGAHSYFAQEIADFPDSETGAINMQDFSGPKYEVAFSATFLKRRRLAAGFLLIGGSFSGTSTERERFPSTVREHNLEVENRYLAAGLRMVFLTSERTYAVGGAAVGAMAGRLTDDTVTYSVGSGYSSDSCGDEWSVASLHGSVGFAYRVTKSLHLLVDTSALFAPTKIDTGRCSLSGSRIGKNNTYDMGGVSAGGGVVYAFQ